MTCASRQNPFYAAMCELGKVIHTLFLMRYLGTSRCGGRFYTS